MIRVVYMSEACTDAGGMSDFDILNEAVEYNARHGITGFLVRTDERFFQVLEGEEQEVLSLVERVKGDPRNKNLEVLEKRSITTRQFKDWAMGFKMLSPVNQELFNSFDLTAPDQVQRVVPAIYKIATADQGLFHMG